MHVKTPLNFRGINNYAQPAKQINDSLKYSQKQTHTSHLSKNLTIHAKRNFDHTYDYNPKTSEV